MMDFITDLPKSKGRYSKDEFNAILVIVYQLIKYTKYIPWKKIRIVEELAYVFQKEVVAYYRTPREIITDRDPLFMSKL